MEDGQANPSAAACRFHQESPGTGNSGDTVRRARVVNRIANFADAPGLHGVCQTRAGSALSRDKANKSGGM
jgi:hypothetical protein